MMNARPSDQGQRLNSRLSLLLSFVAVLFLTSCLLDSDRGGKTDRVWDGSPGFAKMNLGLERNTQHGLGKVSAADTTFGLDTLIVVLTATGADTIVQRYAISGRPDTGVIALSPMVFTLNPLLNWKARFYTIDTTVSPVRRDTVHLDSIIFAVRPADTAVVNKVVSAAFSVVRVRYRSTTQDSIGAAIRFIRLKVGGITRDSVELYGPTYNAVWFANQQTGWLVQDSGRIQKTNDSSLSWFPQTSGTTLNLNSVSFANANTGYIVGDSGLILKTTNGGTNWSSLTPRRTNVKLNRVHFTSADTGYVVGDEGFAMKTVNGGTDWRPVSGGWFKSPNSLSTDVVDIGTAGANNWVGVTSTGSFLTTTNYGATWTNPASSTKPMRAAHFSTTSGRGYLAGDSGFIYRYDGSNFAGQPVVQGSNLYGVFARSNDSGWAVGDSDRVVRNTTNGGSGWAVVSKGGWDSLTPPTNSWSGIGFVSATNGYIVGSGGLIRRTTDRGVNWNTVTVGSARTTRINGLGAHFGSNSALAAADSGYVVRTINGTNWNWYASGAGTGVTWRGAAMGNQRYGWVVGSPNAIRSTNDTGRTWTSRNQNGNWYAVSVSATRAWVVGTGGAVRRSARPLANNVNFAQSVSNGLTADFYAVGFYTANKDTGYIGGAGGVIYRTVNGDTGGVANDSNNVVWTSVTSPTSQDILGMRFINGSTGWVVGRNGAIWRTTDRGTTWFQQYFPGTVDSVRSIWSATSSVGGNGDTAYVVGSNSLVRKTITAGHRIGGRGTPIRLTGVHFPNQNIGYVVGANGAISKSLNAGLNWTPQNSTVTDTLTGVHFTTIDSGWAVGHNGKILRTANGGTTWSAQTVGSTKYRKVRMATSLRGWVVGDGGTVLTTTDGGVNWTAQQSGTTNTLFTVFPQNTDTAYIAGAGGVIRKTLNSGTLVIFYKNINGLYARNRDTVYVVGDSGLAYRTRTGGAAWTQLTGATGIKLNAAYSGANWSHLVGDNGKWYTILYNSAGASLTERTSNMTGTNINGVWGGPTGAQSHTLLVGDSGIHGFVVAVSGGASVDTLPYREKLKGVHCATGNTTCWVVGGRELVMRNLFAPTDSNWNLMSLGAKRFDHTMYSKYLRPGVTDSVIIQAIDRLSPLRGYEKRLGINVGAGQDTTINAGMTRCGYGGLTPACRP